MNSCISSSDGRRYFAVMAAVATLCFVAAWAWVAMMPLAFLEPEFAFWRGKQILLDQCGLGDVVVLGDSRATAGIIPARLPMPATNLAVGGGEAVEAWTVLNRVLACPGAPKLVVLSFDPVHFTRPDLFWERTMRFGFLDAAALADLRQVSKALGDPSVYEARHTDGMPSWLRDRLYLAHFPSYYFASLAEGRLFGRWWRNKAGVQAAVGARGHYYFGTGSGSGVVAADGRLESFRPLPVLAWYFDRILATLDAHRIPSVFVPMPVNQATARAIRPAVLDGFAAWLASREARFPGFRVAGPVVQAWPGHWFGDGFSHLNPAGAARFSDRLAAALQRLQAAPPSTQNDAQKGWFNETGPDASRSVVPISKRGS